MAREFIGNIMGPEGPQGPQGPQGPKGEIPTEEINKINENLQDISVNVKDFGATGDGVTDDTQAIQDASDYASTLTKDKRLLIPKGVYRITGTVKIKNSLDATQATLNYEGTGDALVLGDDSASGIVTSRQVFKAPRIINTQRNGEYWDGTSVGLKCVNLNTCEIHVPFVQDFEKGLMMYGYSHGCAYNTVVLGALWDNHTNLLMDSDDFGWCNQTLFLHGRLQHSLSKGAFENDPDACQIKLGKPGDTTSNNTFINTSIEGKNIGVYRIDIAGSYNHLYNVRIENQSEGTAKVMYREGSRLNRIVGGYHSQLLEEVFETPETIGGVVEDGIAPFIRAELKSNQTIPSGSDYTDLTDMAVDSHRVKYTPETGEFFLKPGKWHLQCKATFGASSGGALYIRLVYGSKVISSQVSRPDSVYQFAIDCSVIEDFDSDTPLKIQVRQSTETVDLKLNANHFTSLIAHYLGG